MFYVVYKARLVFLAHVVEVSYACIGFFWGKNLDLFEEA